MTKRPRRNNSPAFKAKVAFAALRGEQILQELSQRCRVHSNQIKKCKDQLLEGATGIAASQMASESAVSFFSRFKKA